MEEFAASHGHGTLEPWDVAFWSERMREEKFSAKEEELKSIFHWTRLRELFLWHNAYLEYIFKKEKKK